MSSDTKKMAAAPRHPERKWGPFHGGLGVAVWLNQVESEDGKKFFRSITIAPRRYRDRESGEWKDASSLRPADLPSLMLALEAAHEYVHSTPLPGEPAEADELEEPSLLDGRPSRDEIPY